MCTKCTDWCLGQVNHVHLQHQLGPVNVVCIHDVPHTDVVVTTSRTPEVTEVMFEVVLLEETEANILMMHVVSRWKI